MKHKLNDTQTKLNECEYKFKSSEENSFNVSKEVEEV